MQRVGSKECLSRIVGSRVPREIWTSRRQREKRKRRLAHKGARVEAEKARELRASGARAIATTVRRNGRVVNTKLCPYRRAELRRRRAAAEIARRRRLRSPRRSRAQARAAASARPEAVLEQQRRRAQHRRRGSPTPRPAMSGAEPCTGSKIPGPPSERLADGASPRPPVIAAARSERMSPNMFSVTSTSNCSGAIASCIAALSTSMCSTCTSGYSGASSSTTRRHMRDVSSTFALSTDVSRPPRACASAERSPRDPLDLARVVLARVEDRAVFAHAARTEVQAADELAHDEHVDVVEHRRPQVRVRVERRAQREQALLGPHVGRVELRDRRRGPSAPRSQRGTRRASRPAAASRSRGSPRRRSGARRARRRARAARGRAAPRSATSGPMPSPGRRTTTVATRRQGHPPRASAAGGRAGAA